MSPPTSMSTMSVALLPAGADMALSGAASSDGAEVVRSEATGSDGAMIVLAWAKTSWADGLNQAKMMLDPWLILVTALGRLLIYILWLSKE